MSLTKKEYYVRDLVIDDEYGVIESTATVQDAAKKMKELGVPDLVVIEGEKILGVIADFDIIQNVVAKGSDSKIEKVISSMYTIESVSLDTSVTEAFTRMRDLQVNVVPVVENGKLIGVCTIQDCWSYIPDENVDEIGLIPVSNTRNAEFWFASVCSILAFVLGIILPLVGIYGFFSGNQVDLLSLFGTAEIRGGRVIFSLFEARGDDFIVSFINLININGGIWLVIIIFSLLILVFGILGLFAVIFASYSDIRNIQTGFVIRFIIPILVVVFLIIQWILFGIAFAIAVPSPPVIIDGLGLTLSIISMFLIIAAIYRDYIFRQKVTSEEVSS
ncbi:MAG: CBS domain-containing protein [Candidatus Lokiarchaeota archaeon]|nr:CBS domain-containing protein [Candidatus Lokiarchaeota archaeon]